MDDSLYDKMETEMVAGFYYFINEKIDQGILSNAMQSEINLIKRTAKKRGITLEELYEQGSHLVEMQRQSKVQPF
ncbi:hypothetical protein C7437_11239 [Psychrobacillus insolitus]|jgi:hypothetical protein|uniref:Uncharacterized protein n=1 Tax=Psychrobacillus insolitus TaxID=1461 RepID=A0A2W7MYG6_9BACI|nr:hypothetical protein [Psychrobacillus insolitus]PZX02400.1 hypothetical protein C7437_11239 [Psychrobacillus insolitus]